MKIKKEKGIAGIDIIIALIAVIIFSTIIAFLIYTNVTENVKLKKETLAIIGITEIFENVGIQDYENLDIGSYEDIGNNVYSDNIENLVPQDIINMYKVDIIITNEFENVENNEDIMKKIVVTLTYNIQDKEYICSMERMKTKE